MFSLPDSAPWWAVLAVVVLGIVVFGARSIVRAMWPQTSAHRKELLQEWQREQERARQRAEIDNRE